MPEYHKSILLRAKMGVFIRTKAASPSEFECDSNALTLSPIGYELNELRQFYKTYLEMENFRATPSVLQTAVKACVFVNNTICRIPKEEANNHFKLLGFKPSLIKEFSIANEYVITNTNRNLGITV